MSLFFSTLKALFEGRRDLFQGLAAYDQWEATLPGEAETTVGDRLLRLESDCGLQRRYATPAGRLEDLIVTLRRRSGRRVVLLVDEYDKPITDALDSPAVAKANRDYLRKLYSVIKGCQEHIRFSFLTGVSKSSKVSLFSSLNNLYDLTLDLRYSSICSYTNHHLDTVFATELPGLDRDRIREWYNGYSWGGDERLYNPYDVLQHFASRDLEDYWFETGTPKFLPDLLVRHNVSTLDIEGRPADQKLLSAFDIHHVATEALLFQTGCLTVTEVLRDQHGRRSYRLGYPNREVRLSLNRALLSSLVDSLSDYRLTHCWDVARHVRAGDFRQLHQALHAFFASIPHDWYRNSRIERYEG